MKPERAFVAERALAQHCAALLRPGPTQSELSAALDKAAVKLARLLPAALVPLIGECRLEISHRPASQTIYDDYAMLAAPFAANSLHAVGATGRSFFSVIEAASVMALVDRAFGGPGLPPDSLPRTFPLAAELTIDRLEAVIGRIVAGAVGMDAADIVAVRRDGDLAQLGPCRKDCPLAVLTLRIEEGDRRPWSIDLAFPIDTLEVLFGKGEEPVRRKPAPRVPDPEAEPFADLPLTLSAVLVDMTLPLSALTNLAPGAVLPVAVARRVPLRVGEATFATGHVGTAEDRIAVQILQLA